MFNKNSHTASDFDDTPAICYTAALPFKVEPLSDENQIAVWNNTNFILLRAFYHLDIVELPSETKEQPTALDKTMERLEAKVDLTMQLMSMLVHQQTPLPPIQIVSLFTDRLCWQTSTLSVAIDQTLLLTLYISGKIPLPLILPAKVIQIRSLDTQQFEITAKFTGLDENTQDWLDRTIFRFHRREIYAQRGAKKQY